MMKEDSVETLTASTSLDQDRPLESTSASSSSSSSPPSDPVPSVSKSLSFSKLNAKAPEFLPRSNSSSSLTMTSPASNVTTPRSITGGPAPTLLNVYQPARPAGPALFRHLPVQGHFGGGAYHVPVQYNRQYYAGYVAANQQQEFVAAAAAADPGTTTVDIEQGTDGGTRSKNGSDDVCQKVLNQVEYYFSDLNLASTDHLMRFMNKDPEGYVPISVVSSFKKIKALVNSNSQLADILRSSEKLVVSADGKRVKRLHRLTESDMDDLQSRIIVAENLPEDHCHQALMKIFSAVGSVKTIRTCQPQTSNVGTSPASSRAGKSDGMLFSSKLHAFVEYESAELADKAVAELNDENNWRNGLKVRLLLRPKAKSSQARVKKAGHENEPSCKENSASSAEDSLQSDAHSNGLAGDDDKQVQQKKTRNRGRGKGRGRPQYESSNSRGNTMGSPSTSNILVNTEQPITNKQTSVPRMPDGTRGFSMGRGKPIAIKIA